MTQQNQQDPTTENFFDGVGGGGAPTAKLKDVEDFVFGEVVSQRVVDYVPFGKTEPERNKDGSVRKQLVVTLQTEQRNWEGVSKIPVVDPNTPNSPQKDPSEDDGRRSIYLPQWSNIQYAVADAVRKGTGQAGPVRDGAKLGVKVFNLKDTGKGNPLKEHVAHYEAPAASASFFGGSAPAEQATPAPQAQAAPAAQEAPASAPTDPWTGAPASQPAKAPF